MRDLLRDLFWNGTWPNETAPTIPATPMKSAYYFIYIIYILYLYTSVYITMMLQCYTSETCPSWPQAAEPSAGSGQHWRCRGHVPSWFPGRELTASNFQTVSDCHDFAMILPRFCHDVSFQFIHFPSFSMVFHYTGDHYGQIPHPNLCLLQWPLAFQSSWSWPRCKWELLILWTRGRVQPLCTCQSPAQSSILTTVNADIVVTLMPFLNL